MGRKESNQTKIKKKILCVSDIFVCCKTDPDVCLLTSYGKEVRQDHSCHTLSNIGEIPFAKASDILSGNTVFYTAGNSRYTLHFLLFISERYSVFLLEIKFAIL